MTRNLVFSLDGSRGVVPPPFTFSRGSDAWLLENGYFRKYAANEPRWHGTYGLLVEGPATSRVKRASPTGNGDWTGEADFVFAGPARPVVWGVSVPFRVYNKGIAVPGTLTTSDLNASNTSSVTLSCLVETLDATRLAIGYVDTANVVWEKLEFYFSDLSAVATPPNHAYAIEDVAAKGPNGGRLLRVSLSGARTGYDVWIAPTGDYVNRTGAVLHCVQLEERPFPSSPAPSEGSSFIRQADNIYASLARFDLPVLLVADAITAPGTDGYQVLWQVDQGTDDDRLFVGRNAEGVLRLERWSGGVAVDVVALGSVRDGASFGLALVVDTDLSVRWSVNGGAEQTASLTGMSVYSNERLGCSVGLDENWNGYIWKLERYEDN